MNLKIRIVLGFIFVYFIYGLILSNFDVKIIPKELVANNPQGFHDYKGVINVHTLRSSGSGSVDEVIKAAQEAELDFLFLTDLNVFEPLEEVEGYHNNLLVFVGGKYSYLNSRMMVLDAQPIEGMKSAGQAQVVLADLLSQSNRGRTTQSLIMAHPLKPGYHWSGSYPEGLDGLEIINLKSMWQNAWLHAKLSFFWSLLIWPFNERLASLRLFEAPYKELELWDSLTANHRVFGVAGSDAEAKLQLNKNHSISFSSYQALFSLVTNHVLLNSELTGQSGSDRTKIAAAIHQGQFYTSLDALADPKGFNAYIQTAQAHVYPMGSQLKYESELELVVDLPDKPRVPFDVMIYRNGERLMLSNSKSTRMPIHAEGVYRVMVRVIPTLPLPDGKKWIPWIYSNPFYVTAR